MAGCPDRLRSSASITAKCGHTVIFWSIGYDHKWYALPLNCTFKGNMSFPFPPFLILHWGTQTWWWATASHAGDGASMVWQGNKTQRPGLWHLELPCCPWTESFLFRIFVTTTEVYLNTVGKQEGDVSFRCLCVANDKNSIRSGGNNRKCTGCWNWRLWRWTGFWGDLIQRSAVPAGLPCFLSIVVFICFPL